QDAQKPRSPRSIKQIARGQQQQLPELPRTDVRRCTGKKQCRSVIHQRCHFAFLGLPTRFAVSIIKFTVSISFGWTLPAGILILVTSSTLTRISTSANESIRPE